MQHSIVQINNVKSQLNSRIDAEYWHPFLIKLSNHIQLNSIQLGKLIKNGCRVVYETTKILSEDEISENSPKFLQAADIESPIINIEKSGYVSNDDWLRYKKGRTIRGEILLEVKGNVQKVAIVPDNFPEKVLASGTLYKFTVNDNVNKYFIVVYLSCSLGQKLKNRLISNIATPFISKSELYEIPIPLLDNTFQDKIEDVYLCLMDLRKKSTELFEQAKNLLLAEIGLSHWQPKHQLTFIKYYSNIKESRRMDAECSQPKYEEIVNAVKSYSGGWDTLGNLCDLIGHPSNPPYSEKDENNKTFIVSQKHLGEYSLTDDFWKNDDAKHTTKEFTEENEDYILRNDDLVLYTVGGPPHIGKANLIFETNVKATIGSFVTLVRTNKTKINPHTLLTLFNSIIGRQLTNKFQRGMVQQYIYPKDLIQTVVPIPPKKIQTEIQQKITESFALRKQSEHLLECAKRMVEIAIEKDEKTALAWLKKETQQYQE